MRREEDKCTTPEAGRAGLQSGSKALGREGLPDLSFREVFYFWSPLKRWGNVDTAGHGPHRDHITQEGVMPPASHRCEETNFWSRTQHPRKNGSHKRDHLLLSSPWGHGYVSVLQRQTPQRSAFPNKEDKIQAFNVSGGQNHAAGKGSRARSSLAINIFLDWLFLP